MLLVVTFPDPVDPTPPTRLRIDSRGDLATTAFGRCLVDGLRETARDLEIPLPREGGRQLYRLTFPGTHSVLGEEAAACEAGTRAP
jgi:hypothetical protein